MIDTMKTHPMPTRADMSAQIAIRSHIDYSEHVLNRQELEMPSATLNQLVRDQILVEGPQIGDEYETQRQVDNAREAYVDETLDQMTRTEMLERISAALEVLMIRQAFDMSVRLGL
jgi:uncharacterized protein YheU (UPF0270 family)